MRGSCCGVVVLVAVAGWAPPVSAQVHDRDIAFEHCEYLTHPVRAHANSVHEPYTVEYQVSVQQLQKDGNTKTTEYTEVAAFDSQGRWMNSRTVASSPEEELPSRHFCVYDPVAGIRTTWSVPGKQATQMKTAEIESSHSSCEKKERAEAEIFHSKPVVEDLGTKSIQGYVAQGFRTSRSIPTRVNGNSQTTVRTVETWRAALTGLNFSPGAELAPFSRLYDPWEWSKLEKLENFGQKLPEIFTTAQGRTGLLVRQVLDEPGIGKASEEVQDFRQGEPSADLFQPPDGYKIVMKKVPPALCPGEKTATTAQAAAILAQ